MGYVFRFCGAPISWCSKKQDVIALSSCEAECITSCHAACQALWLRSLLGKMHLGLKSAMQLLVENKSTINLAKNPIAHGRSKHIETKHHFLRDLVNKGRLELCFCKFEQQAGDILTKPMKIGRFKKLTKMLNVVPLETFN